MSAQREREPASWRDPEFARSWAAGDRMGDFLALPRAMAASVVALEDRMPRVIVDVGSGPGAFLAVFLKKFPRARGVWFDVSEAMLEKARVELGPLIERVEFRLGDMAEFGDAGLPLGVDAIITSRALHHLGAAGIATFYSDAANHLAPGGWLINLDQVGLEAKWQRRLGAVRPQIIPPNQSRTHHDHPAVLPSIDDHLNALTAAGVPDVDVPWRAFWTVLLMGRASRR